jgi:hypothetical protein
MFLVAPFNFLLWRTSFSLPFTFYLTSFPISLSLTNFLPQQSWELEALIVTSHPLQWLSSSQKGSKG